MNPGWGQFLMTQRGQFRVAFDIERTRFVPSSFARPFPTFARQAPRGMSREVDQSRVV